MIYNIINVCVTNAIKIGLKRNKNIIIGLSIIQNGFIGSKDVVDEFFK